MRRAATILSVAVYLSSPDAEAGNGLKPRVPPLWNGAPCMTLVDRSSDAVLHVPYGIPFEDPPEGETITTDEVSDSRTHQFFAFAREADQVTFLPPWIAQADVDAAAAKGIVEAGSIPLESVLDLAPQWAEAWSRIIADEARRPIEFESAEMGIDWDTGALPAGIYHLEGYTYEPQFNIWTPRPGVVKVHDGDPDAVGPAIALDQIELVLYRNGSENLGGCIDAPAGTTVEGSWSLVRPDMPLAWQVFGEAMIDGGSMQLPFAAPADASGEFIALRAVATSPDGKSYTSHMRALVSILGSDDPNACDEGGGAFVSQPGCNDAGTTEGSSGGSQGGTGEPKDSGGTESTGAADGERAGCGCHADASDRRGTLLFALSLVAAGRRRRRHAAA